MDLHNWIYKNYIFSRLYMFICRLIIFILFISILPVQAVYVGITIRLLNKFLHQGVNGLFSNALLSFVLIFSLPHRKQLWTERTWWVKYRRIMCTFWKKPSSIHFSLKKTRYIWLFFHNIPDHDGLHLMVNCLEKIKMS